jgi:hypothetical protein
MEEVIGSIPIPNNVDRLIWIVSPVPTRRQGVLYPIPQCRKIKSTARDARTMHIPR